jgi:hypothetical protein
MEYLSSGGWIICKRSEKQETRTKMPRTKERIQMKNKYQRKYK